MLRTCTFHIFLQMNDKIKDDLPPDITDGLKELFELAKMSQKYIGSQSDPDKPLFCRGNKQTSKCVDVDQYLNTISVDRNFYENFPQDTRVDVQGMK